VAHKLNLAQRLLNRIGRPLGIAPFPIAWDPPEDASDDRSVTFDTIFHENWWNSRESVSGRGSELRQTTKYRHALIEFLLRNRFTSMFDAPCGDLNWMREVLPAVPIRYIGGDISNAVLTVARSRCPSLDLRLFDICADRFPDADVWHCRDALLHLSFADIWAALGNAARSEIKFALLTTHRGRLLRNLDIRTGGVRPLDLERAPFNLPSPVEYLQDSSGLGFPRAVGVWPIDVVRKVVARGKQVR
jgi:SAM-dependent methyltransferase